MFWVFGCGIAGCQFLTTIFRPLRGMTVDLRLRLRTQIWSPRPSKSLQPTIIPLRGMAAAEIGR